MKVIVMSAVMLVSTLSTPCVAQDHSLRAQCQKAFRYLADQSRTITLDSTITTVSTSVGAALGGSYCATAGDHYHGRGFAHALIRNGDFYAGALLGGMIGKLVGCGIVWTKDGLYTPARNYVYTPIISSMRWVRNAFGNRLEAAGKRLKTT
jgi:hypothetical protein